MRRRYHRMRSKSRESVSNPGPESGSRIASQSFKPRSPAGDSVLHLRHEIVALIEADNPPQLPPTWFNNGSLEGNCTPIDGSPGANFRVDRTRKI